MRERVHDGQMAQVWRGLDRARGAAVAIKAPLLDRKRFADEVAFLRGLDHPAIVRHVAHDLGEAPYLVMDWIEGPTLSALLSRRRLTMREGVALCRRVAEGLAASHRAQIVHRDVKPTNILLAGDAGDGAGVDGATLIDFGVAQRDSPVRGLTAHPSFVGGTWAYMSPEQLMGAAEMGARVDVFALGCVLFECVAGVRAYPVERAAAMTAKVWKEPPRLRDVSPEIPAELDAVVALLMAREGARRPKDCGAALAELRRLPSLPDVVAQPKSP